MVADVIDIKKDDDKLPHEQRTCDLVNCSFKVYFLVSPFFASFRVPYDVENHQYQATHIGSAKNEHIIKKPYILKELNVEAFLV